MLKKYSLKALQTAINHALSLDADIASKIQPLRGKVLHMVISPLDVNFFIRFDEKNLQLLDTWDGAVNTTIHSNPLGLIRLSILPASKARSLFNDKIRLSGEVETGQQVKALFDNLDIDWEGHLAHFTGDVVAYQVGSILKHAKNFTRQFTESMRLNTRDYLQEELRLVPTTMELEDLFADIDALALQVERLQAKVDLITDPHESDKTTL